jgi:membrane protease YdiL (CAAX protease family)
MPELASHSTPPNDPWLRAELIAPWWKIIYVVGVMLGAGIITGAFYSEHHQSGSFFQRLSDYFFIKDAAFESGFLALFLFFLRYRGWTISDFRIRIGWWTSLCGVGLFFLTTLGVYLVNHFTLTLARDLNATPFERWISLLVPRHPDLPPGSVPLRWITIIGFTLLNAFYEELVYMGYVFNQWATKYGPEKAVLFTSFIRLIVHSYQGTEHILPIGLWSLLFGFWYRSQGKLWPLILAHFLIDLLSLSLFKMVYGAP